MFLLKEPRDICQAAVRAWPASREAGPVAFAGKVVTQRGSFFFFFFFFFNY